MIRRSLTLCWLPGLCLVACGTAAAQSSVPAVVAPSPVTWLIVVDDLHLDFRNTGRIRNALRTIAAELIREGDRFALASSGPSALAVDVATDRQLLDAAIKKTTGNALKHEDVTGSADGPVEARYRASIAVATAQEVLNNLSRLPPGPRAVLYISNGYDFDILPDRPTTSPRLPPGLIFTRSEVREQLTQLIASAMRAGVRIFAIDPRVGFDDPVPGPSDPAWPAHRSAMRSVLQSISDGSGGLAIVDGDFVSQLRRVADAIRK